MATIYKQDIWNCVSIDNLYQKKRILYILEWILTLINFSIKCFSQIFV